MASRSGVPWAALAAVALVVVAADQATKGWALHALQGAAPRTVIPGFFNLTFGRNTGGVFGLFAGAPSTGRRVLFAAATAAALGVILAMLRHWGRESRLLCVALALIAGGAVGNLIDRLRFGSVVDFIDWYWRGFHWYTFNVADSAITLGAVLLLIQSFLPERPPGPAKPASSAPAGPGA